MIDEGSNHALEASQHSKQGSTSLSPIRSTMRSPGLAAHSNNRMSPVIGYHNNSTAHSNNRVSPVIGAPTSRTSPLTNTQHGMRKSPITSSSNRMSPGLYGGAGGPGSRPSSRQSPGQPSRQSPIVSRQSPMDGVVKSPLTSVESPTSRVNHLYSDLSKHSSLSENNIPHALAQKSLEASRSLNSLGAHHPQTMLLRDQYDNLSDDER